MSVSSSTAAKKNIGYKKIGEYTHKNGNKRSTYLVMGTVVGLSSLVRPTGTKVYTVKISMPNGHEFEANTVNKTAVESYSQNIQQLIVIQKDDQYGNLLCEPFTAISDQMVG